MSLIQMLLIWTKDIVRSLFTTKNPLLMKSESRRPVTNLLVKKQGLKTMRLALSTLKSGNNIDLKKELVVMINKK